MMPTPLHGGMSALPVSHRRGKDGVPMPLYNQGGPYADMTQLDPRAFSTVSAQWANLSQEFGALPDSCSTPSLTPTGTTFDSCNYTAGTPGGRYSNLAYGANGMLPPPAAQPLTEIGNLFAANSGFQTQSNPFFFCSDLQFPNNQPNLYAAAPMDGGFPQMQPPFQQQQMMHRTQQLNSAVMLQRYWGNDMPPQLKDTCPDEERYLFHLCWEHRFKEEGQMWDFVEGEFQTIFSKTYTRDQLKYKLARCRAKYIEWLPRDREILRKAWMRIEQNRYQSLLEHFYALGGSRNMMLSANDIQHKVVNDMRLEDDLYVEEKEPKKSKKRVGCQQCPSCRESQDNNTIVWCDRYAGTAHN